MLKGKINSFQSLGTLDGKGVRFVVFSQGCPLRCACCHNPETWELTGGTEYTAEEILQRVKNYRDYFGEKGGITVSGGEPLLQADFFAELFRICKENGINTCLDTSGCILNESTERLLKVTDYCLLDIKYTLDTLYKKYVGCSLSSPLLFLDRLNELNIPTRLRQVIIKGINDNNSNISRLKDIAQKFKCVEETELLPFRKICEEKYNNLGIAFKLKSYPETDEETIRQLNNLFEEKIKKTLD